MSIEVKSEQKNDLKIIIGGVLTFIFAAVASVLFMGCLLLAATA